MDHSQNQSCQVVVFAKALELCTCQAAIVGSALNDFVCFTKTGSST